MKLAQLGSINRTLFLLLLLTMLPVVAILLYSSFEQKKLSVADAKKDIFLLTNAMAEVQKDQSHSVRQTLAVLSLLKEIQSLEGAEVSAIFKSIVWQNQAFHNIALVGLDGKIIASAIPFDVEVNLRDRKHIREAIEQRDFSVGEYVFGKIGTTVPVFPYAFPVFDENLALVAILTATIKLDYFADFHEIASLPGNSFISVTDHKGVRLFYYPPKISNPVGSTIQSKSWDTAQRLGKKDNRGSFSGSGSDGTHRIFAFEQIRVSRDSAPYMYVWSGIPEKDILSAARKALARNMVLLFASMILSFVIFWFFGKKILIEPINRLIGLTQKFTEGRLSPSLEPPSGSDELRVLNDAFIDMATEITKNQQTIHESEYRFRQIFNNMTNGVVIFEPVDAGNNFVVKDINPAGTRHGTYSREELIGKSIFTALPQIFDVSFFKVLQRVYQTELPEHFPVTRCEDGSVQLWIESYIFKLPTGEIVVVCDDITERKNYEEERLRSDAKFRAVIDQASDAIFVADDEGNILLCNKCAYESLGYTEEELLKLAVDDIDPTFGQRNDKQEMWQGMRVGDVASIETSHQSKNGRVFPVEINISRIEMDGQYVILGIVRDISLRKEFEASLKRSKEEWENTFNAMDDIITIQDKDMNIIKANKAFYNTFSEHSGELSQLPFCYEIFHSNKKICKTCPAHRTFSDGSIQRKELIDEGTNKAYSVSTFPLLSDDGSFEHIVHVVKDITESKKLEEELFQSHKMEAIGTLAGGIAHDFNNILSAIMGFAEFIKEDVPSTSQTAEDATEILRATNRAKDLVKQILTFSRKNDPIKSVIEPHLVVLEALNLICSTFPVSITIKESIQTDCGSILANATNLHQVVLNLCANARLAMIGDKGLLSVELKRVERTAEQLPHEKDIKPGHFVQIVVTDNGCGMSPEDLERIFEPYYTTREVGAGSGLGLSVTHGIVEECNGFIEVDSTIGEGTSFSVYFPCHEDEENVEKPAPTEMKLVQAGPGETLLLVDDEPLLLDINSRRLQQLGYQIVTTESSKEALELFLQDPTGFDLLITDQTMPELTGEDLAREILKNNPLFPIIVCTGHSESFTEEKARAMGVKKYVYKPVLGNELMDAVREVLDS